jgi:hypothetical protein
VNGATYMGRVAQMACRICVRLALPSPAVEVHHQRAGTGGGRRASDWRTMPLCREHHRGDAGIHGLGTKAFARTYGVTEQALVEETWALVGVARAEVESWEAAQVDRRVSATARVRGKAVVVLVAGPEDEEAMAAARLTVAAFRAVKLPPRAARMPMPRSAWPKRKLESRNTLKRR